MPGTLNFLGLPAMARMCGKYMLFPGGDGLQAESRTGRHVNNNNGSAWVECLSTGFVESGAGTQQASIERELRN